MNKQLRMFESVRHLEADHFISGTPDIPDPYEGDEWIYPIDGQYALFHGELAYNGELIHEIGKAACELRNDD